jgi:hypothetical protein
MAPCSTTTAPTGLKLARPSVTEWIPSCSALLARFAIQGKTVLSDLSIRIPSLRDGVIGHAQIVKDASDVAGKFIDSGGNAVGTLGLDQTRSEAAQAGHVFRSVAGAQGATVLIPVPVENVVVGFNAPVSAVECQKTGAIGTVGGMVGQGADDLGGFLAGLLLDALALDEEELSDVGENPDSR